MRRVKKKKLLQMVKQLVLQFKETQSTLLILTTFSLIYKFYQAAAFFLTSLQCISSLISVIIKM